MIADLTDLIVPETVVTGMVAPTRKALFQQLGAIASARWGLDQQLVADRLGARERIGSTGFGGGVAMPHARFDGLDRVGGIFVRLNSAIDFDAIDELPVDLVFALLSPEAAGAQHLKALARVSRALRERDFRAKLRGAGSPDAVYALLVGVDARDAA